MFDMLGKGILNTDGDLWKSHRKLASLEFSVKKLRKLSSTVYVANALKLLNLLASRASQGVDMQVLSRSICLCLFCRWPSIFQPESTCILIACRYIG
jgi:cytochrome P450